MTCVLIIESSQKLYYFSTNDTAIHVKREVKNKMSKIVRVTSQIHVLPNYMAITHSESDL